MYSNAKKPPMTGGLLSPPITGGLLSPPNQGLFGLLGNPMFQMGVGLLQSNADPRQQAFAGLLSGAQNALNFQQHQDNREFQALQRKWEEEDRLRARREREQFEAMKAQIGEILSGSGSSALGILAQIDPVAAGTEYYRQQSRPDQRRIVQENGLNYWADTGERVVPGAEAPLPEREMATDSWGVQRYVDDGSEVFGEVGETPAQREARLQDLQAVQQQRESRLAAVELYESAENIAEVLMRDDFTSVVGPFDQWGSGHLTGTHETAQAVERLVADQVLAAAGRLTGALSSDELEILRDTAPDRSDDVDSWAHWYNSQVLPRVNRELSKHGAPEAPRLYVQDGKIVRGDIAPRSPRVVSIREVG